MFADHLALVLKDSNVALMHVAQGRQTSGDALARPSLSRQPALAAHLLEYAPAPVGGTAAAFDLPASHRVAAGQNAVDQRRDGLVHLVPAIMGRIVGMSGSGSLQNSHDLALGQDVPVVQRKKQ
jgi:hypothetical protein